MDRTTYIASTKFLLLLCFQQLLFNIVSGCYSWKDSQIFYLSQDDWQSSNTEQNEVKTRRSFIECSLSCDVAEGCIGVGFQDPDYCHFINGSAAADFDTSQKTSVKTERTDYMVMILNTTFLQEVNKNVLLCQIVKLRIRI